MTEAIEIDGVWVSHPDRVLFPDMGLTKRDLIDYYAAVADRMLPYVVDRPVSLVRCPEGRQRDCFFQKHTTEGMPDAFGVVPIREASGQVDDYLSIGGIDGLVAGVQIGTLEFHIWGARSDMIEKPDRLVFDLDPDPAVAFPAVRAAAEEIRDFLGAAGLETFPLLTGGKGIHVVAPLTPHREWPDVKRFARAVADALADRAPDRYVAAASKARRRGRIFIDYLRNDRGSTAIAPYSTRARPGAAVAAPITWDELARTKSAAAYDVKTMARRKADPWKGYFKVKQSLTPALLKAAGV